MTTSESVNFGFLVEHDELLARFGAAAERHVFDDPNTSLLKTRQLGELLARHAVARQGFDPTHEEFADLIQTLRRLRLIDARIRGCFDTVRLRGNEASHQGLGDRQGALVALVAAHEASKWFHATYGSGEFTNGPFRPPPDPKQVSAALEVELRELREQAVEYEQKLDAAQGRIVAIEEARARLESETEQQFRQLAEAEKSRTETAERERSERLDLENRLRQIEAEAKMKTPSELQSIIDRSREAAWRIGYRVPESQPVPITRLRLLSSKKSRCHGADKLLAQYSQGGFVIGFCVKCRREESVRSDEYTDLPFWISCPTCKTRAMPAVVKSNYGFSCDKCGWRCFLASLLPTLGELNQS